MSWTDRQIDDLYRKSANGLSFEYKAEYWAEMSSQLPMSNIAPITDSDAVIDRLYEESVHDTSFTYKPEYWQTMEAMLPQKRRPDFLWFFASMFFLGFMFVTPFMSDDLGFENKEGIAGTEFDNVEGNDAESKTTSNEKSDESPAIIEIDPSTLNIYLPNLTNYQMPSCGGVIYDTHPFLSELNNWPTNGVNGIFPGTAGVLDGKNELDKGEVENLAIRPLVDQHDKELTSYPILPSKVKSTVVPYVQAFGGLSQSLITPSEALSYSYGVGAGIEIQNRNFSMSAGLNGLVSNHNDLELNRSAKVYGFGSDIYQFKVDYQQLYTLEGNLELGYAFKRHKVKLGIRPSYTFSSRVRVNESGENILGDAGKTATDRSIYGYMGGVRRFGVKPMVGYAFKLSPSLEMGLNIGVQLMPMIHEELIDGKNNKLPIDGQLYLKKTISFK